ncbi:MAG: GvpL/GvpF family gas vesicle protein [Bacteroidota bacterium]
METELFYIYGILKSESFKHGIANEELTAAYDRVSEEDFGQKAIKENLQNMDWVNKHVLKHQERLNQLANKHTVIPLKFGSIFKTEESIKKMLSDQKDGFSQLLERFEGKKEWGFKLFYTESKLQNWLKQHTSELKSVEQQLSNLSDGGAFLLKKKHEDLLKRVTKNELNSIREEIYDIVAAITSELIVQKEQDQALTGRKDKNLLNIALLVSQEKKQQLVDKLEKIDQELKAKSITVELSGPWPPYSFVTNG